MPDDYSSTTQTTGAVAVGGSATGEIETSKDFDWFAVDLVAGHTYVIDLEGADSGGGALQDPVLRGLYDADGNRIAGARDNDGGTGRDARLTFTATTTGTYYIEARGHSNQTGDYTVRVTEWVDTDAERGGAADLGDIAGLAGPQFPAASLDGSSDSVDYWRFTLSEARRVGLGLRQQDANADLFLEDAEGNVLYSGTEDGTANEWISQTLLAGTYFVRVEAQEEGANEFKLRYGVGAANPAVVAALEQQQQEGTDEAPAFAEGSYAFSLAENADGGTTPVSLGSVSATDPEDSTIIYSIEAGDSGGLFAIDSETGALSYQGMGEDYESGTTSYDLTVRASDGGLHSDVTVTVNVTDAQEAPAFAEGSYAFDLAENADGGAISVALGAVSATDPENSTITYSIEAGNSGGLFAIDSETGALSYQGAGEDYESGTTSYELTVRAGDGSLHSDVAVTVNVTDVEEYVILEQEATETQQSVSEPNGQDLPAGASTTGLVAVGGSATGNIGTGSERDWFAVEFEAGRTYVIDLEGSETGAGTLRDPYLRGVYDANGVFITGTRNDDGGAGYNSRVTFTAEEAGTYYVAAGAFRGREGTYTVRVREWVDTDAERGGATDLGDITELAGPQFPAASLDGSSDSVDYWRFTLSEARRVGVDLRQQDANADLFLEDAEGNVLYSSTEDGTANEWISQTLLAGTYFVRVEAQEEGANEFKLRYGVSAANPAEVAALEQQQQQQQQQQQGTDEAPEFVSGSYGFSLAENADGATTSVALGMVSATDPEDGTVSYSIEAGNSDGLFAIDSETGALSYQGTGEDYESGTTSYELTVRASDGSLHSDVTVTVNVTDAQEAPAFAEGSYAFDLAENTDGGTISVALGAVSATDPENSTTTYSIEAGDSDGLFAIDSETGALSYRGAGEDYESGTTSYELTVRASDGSLHSDVTVTVNVTDVADVEEYVILEQEATETQQSVSEPDGEDLPGDVSTTGRVAVGGSARGDIDFGHDRDWFAVTLEAGRSYRIDLKGTGGGTLVNPYLRGIYDADGDLIAHTTNDNYDGAYDSRVYFTAEEAGTYYVAASVYGYGTGAYSLSVAELADGVPDDFAAGIGTTGRVAVDGSARGEIESGGDRDWFAVTLDAGRTYRIDMEGVPTGAGTLWDPYLRGVHDADGNFIAGTTDDNSGKYWNSVVTFTAEADGTYYYVAAGADGTSVGTYKLSVRDLTDTITDDYAAGTGTTGAVAVGGSTRGEIEFDGDRDWFAVTLEADKTYQIDLKGSHSGNGALYDPYLRGVRDADGNFIAGTANGNFEISRNSRVYFTVEADGTYYVAAGAAGLYDGAGTFKGTYTLSVTDVEDEFTAGTGTTGAVAVGGSARGEIEFRHDRDWFAVTLEADKTYRIDIRGSWTDDGTLWDPYLRGVHDADGVLIAGTTNDNGGVGRQSRVTFTPEEAGTYYVAAGAERPYGQNEFHGGTYTLSVVDITDGVPDDFEAGTGTTGTVAAGGLATGEIEFRGDQDWFAVTLEAGTIYRIDLEGSQTRAGTLYDPFLRGVYDANGVRLPDTTNDSVIENPNSRVYFTPGEDATYYVAAGADGYWEGTYTLSVTEATDGLAAGTGTSGSVEVDGSATGDIEFPGDQDWFAVDLDAGKTYQIDLKGSHTGNGTLFNPYLRGVHDADGNFIAGTTNDDVGTILNSRVYFTPEEAGTYYVAAGGYGRTDGTYRLSVADVTDDVTDDFEAGTGTTGVVAVGEPARGEIEMDGDRDWFAVALEAGKSYAVDIEGRSTGNGSLSDPYLRGIHDAEGNYIAGTSADRGGYALNERVTFTAEEDATYYIAASAFHQAGEGTYKLSVAEYQDDFAAGTGTSGVVAVRGSASGEIDVSGDRDWFAVELDAGTTYRFNLEGSGDRRVALSDPWLRGIHDADGVLIAGTANNPGYYQNERVTFTAEDAGTYYVAAGGDISRVGAYTLWVADDRDDFAAGTRTSGAVEVGGSAAGEIENRGDRDWFAVTLEEGTTYQIDLKGSWTGGGTLWDPYLYGVHDANGNFIAGTTDDDGGVGDNSRVTFTAAADATYYVAAGTYGDDTGTYTLSVVEESM